MTDFVRFSLFCSIKIVGNKLWRSQFARFRCLYSEVITKSAKSHNLRHSTHEPINVLFFLFFPICNISVFLHPFWQASHFPCLLPNCNFRFSSGCQTYASSVHKRPPKLYKAMRPHTCSYADVVYAFCLLCRSLAQQKFQPFFVLLSYDYNNQRIRLSISIFVGQKSTMVDQTCIQTGCNAVDASCGFSFSVSVPNEQISHIFCIRFSFIIKSAALCFTHKRLSAHIHGQR